MGKWCESWWVDNGCHHWQATNNEDDDDDVKLMMTCWIVTRCVRNVYSLSSICVRILLQANFNIHAKWLGWVPFSLMPRFNITHKMKSELRSFKWGTSSSFTLSSSSLFDSRPNELWVSANDFFSLCLLPVRMDEKVMFQFEIVDVVKMCARFSLGEF